jgi:hypothetical protein
MASRSRAPPSPSPSQSHRGGLTSNDAPASHRRRVPQGRRQDDSTPTEDHRVWTANTLIAS